MRNFLFIVFLLFTHLHTVFGQTATVYGTVTDSITHTPVMGTVVAAGNNNGTVTDSGGSYQIKLSAGTYLISFSFVGYSNQERTITLQPGEKMILNILLPPNTTQLDAVVISGSRFEKKISEETVSMEILKPAFIESTNATKMDEAISKMPGVNVVDGQANIRGGSGFSYGAGSRVLVLVDDIPQLAADAGDVKWEFLPLENLDQVEIIKGASSVLYGSSALNGVINIRTAYPTSTPVTKINFYQGIYQNPQRKELIWWGNHQPAYTGSSFMYSQKFGQFDLATDGNLFTEQSFREGEYYQRARTGMNTRYRFKHIDGLAVGLNANYLYAHTGTFFIWANDSTGGYRPMGGTDTATTTLGINRYHRLNIDPFLTYFSKSGDRHSLKMRYYQTKTISAGNKSTNANYYYVEYQYQHSFRFGLRVTAGVTGNFSDVVADLYGNHHSDNEAAYIQADQKFGRLSLVAGSRYELFHIDKVSGNSSPVFRGGANFLAGKATHFRASYGQGYRFPSIAEKFVNTNVGALKIFPNPDVKPENGWTAEAGINQGIKFGKLTGYVDAAAFLSRYNNFMQFVFGFYPPYPYKQGDEINITDLSRYLGFKSINLEDAVIKGIELTTGWQLGAKNFHFTLTGGITLINPVDLRQKKIVDSTISANPNIEQSLKDSLRKTEILEYRSNTTAKMNFDVSYKKFSTGVSLQYNSFMINVDPIFEGDDANPLFAAIFRANFPIVKEYRKKHDDGNYLFDWRFAYDINKKATVSLIVKNLLNYEYAERPAMIEQPRNFVLQANFKF